MAELNVIELQALSTRRQTDSDPRLLDREMGPSLKVLARSRQFNQFVTAKIGKFDPDNISMRQMAQMRRDPMIKMGLHYTKVPLINAPWHIECRDPQIASFVENALKPVYTRLMLQMLIALEFGYSPIVKRFRREVPDWQFQPDPTDPERLEDVWPNKNIPAVVPSVSRGLDPDGAEVLFTPDENSFDGFRHTRLQRKSDDAKELRVPVTHALWVTHEKEENFGNWYGYPLTGYAFRYWWSYWFVWLLLDKHTEQDADPPLFVRYPTGNSPDPDDPTQDISNYQIALKGGDALRDGATMAAPSDVYVSDVDGRPTGTYKWDAKFLTGGYNGSAFQDRLEHMEVMKLRALMVPEQALIEGAKGTGSRNVAQVYGAAFAESQEIRMRELDELLNDYYIPDLVRQNFLNPPPVRKVTTGFRDADTGIANQLLTILAQSDPKAIRVDIEELARGQGLPVLKPGEVVPDVSDDGKSDEDLAGDVGRVA